MIIGEYFNGEVPQHEGYFVYWVNLRKHYINYEKIGTSRNLAKRFKAKDYKEYEKIKVLYVAEFDNETEMMNFEELNKCYLREKLLLKEIKGMKWIANDRFTYNKRPQWLPIMYRMDAPRFLELK